MELLGRRRELMLLPLEVSIQGHGYGLGIAIRVTHHRLRNLTNLEHSSGCKTLSHNYTNCHLMQVVNRSSTPSQH
jgi:hypothetical protein